MATNLCNVDPQTWRCGLLPSTTSASGLPKPRLRSIYQGQFPSLWSATSGLCEIEEERWDWTTTVENERLTATTDLTPSVIIVTNMWKGTHCILQTSIMQYSVLIGTCIRQRKNSPCLREYKFCRNSIYLSFPAAPPLLLRLQYVSKAVVS